MNILLESDISYHTIEAAIVFEDSRFLVVNKPAGLASHGGSGKSAGLIEIMRILRPRSKFLQLAHRLDKATSGCLIMAKRSSALRAFQQQQQMGKVDKTYLALLDGVWLGGQRKINAPLLKVEDARGARRVRVDAKGKASLSWFTPVQKFNQASLLRVALRTGRTHQIRVHAQSMDQPILGDEIYGNHQRNIAMRDLGLQRMFLHAERLRFSLPEVGAFEFLAPVPQDLTDVLGKLQRI